MVRRGPPTQALAHLHQQGSARIRLPASRAAALEAVLINTAGGLTGDDRLDWSVSVGAGGHGQVSTAAAEKLYRSHGPPAQVFSQLQVGEHAVLEWLPQETIVFDRSALLRHIDVELAPSATLLMVESTLLGRRCMGERLRSLQFTDHWRVRRGGRLLHAEALHLNERVLQYAAAGASSAVLPADHCALATVLFCSPESNEAMGLRAERLRALLNLPSRSAEPAMARAMPEALAQVSALPHRLLLRVIARDGFQLRRLLMPAIASLSPARQLPRVWHT